MVSLRLLSVIAGLALVGAASVAAGQVPSAGVECGDTITTDTTLDRDLSDCPSNGIVIGADDITLDLNGHTVGGDGTEFAGCPENEFCDIGLLNDGHDGVKLRDGSVRRSASGALVVGSRRNRVVDITVSRNAGTGIILFKSSRNTVIGNSARANGLQLDQGGISLNRSHHNLIEGNALRRNGDLGVFMEISDNNRIRKNRMFGHPEGGVIVITKLTGHGAVGNVVRRNYVRGARSSGIAVDNRPKRTLIRRNRVVGSRRHGIIVGSSSTKLTENRALRNGDLGITAVKGVTDGGGNIARHNGDPRQCVNVKCR